MENIIQTLKAGNYKVEDQIFRNMKRFISFGDFKPFPIESKLSDEEKIQIIDKYNDGLASYMITLITKWNEEKESLPKDNWGNPKTVSEKAWIKRNDTRKKVNSDYKIGSYSMLGTKFKVLDMICPSTEYGRNMGYTGQSVINQWFHGFCLDCYNKETTWFKENDPLQIKIKKVKDLGNQYHTVFNCKLLNDIVWNQEKNVTDKELDVFIGAYEALEKRITEQAIMIENTLGKDVMYKDE